MNEYPVGSICEVIDVSFTSVFKHMLGEVVTITGQLRPHKQATTRLIYDVNDRELRGIDKEGDVVLYTPRHVDLKLIRPPSSEKGLELILGMFPKVEVTA